MVKEEKLDHLTLWSKIDVFSEGVYVKYPIKELRKLEDSVRLMGASLLWSRIN